jgi:predicted TIM-barrel fold metal-dependent hydrolase
VTRIDCDVHPRVPSMSAITPFMPRHWQDSVADRGIPALDSIAYPPGAPLSCKPAHRAEGGPAADAARLARDLLDPLGLSHAILNPLWGVPLVFNEDMAAAFATALNDWIAAEWLDRDARLRASIVIPLQDPEAAVAEIERRARDGRFVQVLVPVMGEVPLGRRSLWPVWRAAAAHGLPLGVHAGSAYRHPVTSLGWPSHYIEDAAAQAQGFQSALTSLVCEGAFARIPALRVVLIESGVTWLPGYLWRLDKFWRGARQEVPWVDRPPSEITRDHIRLTARPFDAPEHAVAEMVAMLGGAEMLLAASDYPHWQDDAPGLLPPGFDPALLHALADTNPRAAYPRLEA